MTIGSANIRSFASDNHSGIHPAILKAIMKANVSHAPSYGTDTISEALHTKIQELLGPEAQPFLVFNGTAANTLAIKTILKPWQSLICADISHLNLDECAAPESVGGIKLIPIKTNSEGKLTPDAIRPHLIRFGDQHFAQVGGISITQPTEVGTVYSLEELAALADLARSFQLKLHIDGARIANALSFLNLDFHAILKTFPADALSLGGTKNGLMGAELVIFWCKQTAAEFKYIRKQNLQLPSKTRFLATQMRAYLSDRLYEEIANHSHRMAKQLAEGLQSISSVRIRYPVQSNAVFIEFPKAWTAKLRECRFFYIWETEPWTARLMTSFDTSDSDIEEFLMTLKELEINHTQRDL